MLTRKIHLTISYLCGMVLFFVLTNAFANPTSNPTSNPTLVNNSPLIKAGSVAFARLDTSVDSDDINKQVVATIIDGKYKGAQLRGKLMVLKGTDDEDARTILHFTSFRLDQKAAGKPINAYAIDFDTVRTAIISETDDEYLKHNGTNLAVSFLEDYTNAAKVRLGSGNDLGILFMSNVG